MGCQNSVEPLDLEDGILPGEPGCSAASSSRACSSPTEKVMHVPNLELTPQKKVEAPPDPNMTTPLHTPMHDSQSSFSLHCGSPMSQNLPEDSPKAPTKLEPLSSSVGDSEAMPSDMQSPSTSSASTFPLPEGWKVVCRLSPGDARSRWNSRPRGGGGAGSDGANLEARLHTDAFSQPLRLPMQLLPFWVEPVVGLKFANRYEVKRKFPPRPGANYQLFEVFDEQDRIRRALQVCTLNRDADVKMFVSRLQLEALDKENRHFLRLRDVALSLPGHLGVVEDLPSATLLEELGKCPAASPLLVEKLAAAACSALDGLARLHSHGWVLCSVSPHSICLALDGAWKLNGLQHAKQISELPSLIAEVATMAPILPEVLLDLPLTEKLDLWLLGASLCEALTQTSIGCFEGRSQFAGRSESDTKVLAMCKLVEFLGPLPVDVVAKLSHRETLFTPEGHVLRPATPGVDSSLVYEAIEPPEPQPEVREQHPRLVVQALNGLDGSAELLDFLGRLLHPDPAQRPSASEALECQFLRAAKAKLEPAPSTPETSHPSPGSTKKSAEDTDGGIFSPEKTESQWQTERISEGQAPAVPLRPTPPKTPKPAEVRNVRVEAFGGEAKQVSTVDSRAPRKGTGFVNTADLPDDEEEDEDQPKPKHVHIEEQDEKVKPSTQGSIGSKPVRKGTGFVNTADLPDSEDEEEEEPTKQSTSKNKEVKIDVPEDTQAVKQETEVASKPARKGTGFVNVADLPDSDGEDEEEETRQQPSKSKEVKIEAPEDTKVADKESSQAASKPVRKGTGFVNAADLPDSDDEDEEVEDTSSKKISSKQKEVKIEVPEETKVEVQSADAVPSKPTRKGTGFVNVADLPDSDDEDEDEPKKAVAFDQAAASAAEKTPDQHQMKAPRKGTGYVNSGDLPDDDNEEEEEAPKTIVEKKVVVKEAEKEASETVATPSKPTRKGTGFVNAADLPDSDDEDDEDPQDKKKAVSIKDERPETEKPESTSSCHQSRKGTGFVNTADIPEDSGEEEETSKHTHFAEDSVTESKPLAAVSKPTRKGTGFVNAADLPDSEDEGDDDEDPNSKAAVHVNFDKAVTEDKADLKEVAAASKPTRKGTGFVNTADLPDSEEEDEEEPKATKHVTVAEDVQDRGTEVKQTEQSKPSRKGTGFVNVADLPDSDDEDEDETPATSKHKVAFDPSSATAPQSAAAPAKVGRKGTGFVNTADLPDDEEDDEEEETSKKLKKVIVKEAEKETSSNTPATASKPTRKGTGFVNVADLPDSEDEDEDEDQDKKKAVSIKDDRDEDLSSTALANKSCRKGTGYVNQADLPEVDSGEEEEPQKKTHFSEEVPENTASTASTATTPSKPTRKGTGFVNVADLPDSEDEDEEEEVPKKKEAAHVAFEKEVETEKEVPESNEPSKPTRKGTGFVNVADLPDSDDEEEEEERKHAKHVTLEDTKESTTEAPSTSAPSKPVRKGTGFVNTADLPDSEDEEEEDAPKTKVAFDDASTVKDAHSVSSSSSSKGARKGTGFVNSADIPDDEEEEEEESEHKSSITAAKAVRIEEDVKSDEKKNDVTSSGSKPTRKGTGFVNVADLPDSEDEEDDEAPEGKPKPEVKSVRIEEAISEKKEENQETVPIATKPARKGTGFVNVADLPDSEEEEDD